MAYLVPLFVIFMFIFNLTLYIPKVHIQSSNVRILKYSQKSRDPELSGDINSKLLVLIYYIHSFVNHT